MHLKAFLPDVQKLLAPELPLNLSPRQNLSPMKSWPELEQLRRGEMDRSANRYCTISGEICTHGNTKAVRSERSAMRKLRVSAGKLRDCDCKSLGVQFWAKVGGCWMEQV